MTRSLKLFLGKHYSALDKENRLLTPPAFRDQLSSGIYITQGFDRNLLVLTSGAFQEIYTRVKSLSMTDPIARLLLRLIFGTANELTANTSGYLTIPPSLKDFAGLQEDALLIGQGDYFEIWSPELWDTQETQIRDAETNSTRFSELTVTAR